MMQSRGEWHAWFAWHPVELEGVTAWLQVIERRLVEHMGIEWWQYRFIEPDTQVAFA